MPFVNELRPEYASTPGINPLMTTISPSRLVMFCGHIGQALIIAGANANRLTSGAEREYGKFTFKIKAPCDMRVVKIIDRYPITIGSGAIRENPESLVIYESAETGEFGTIKLPKFKSCHQHFGFEYKYKPNYRSEIIVPEGDVGKGVVIADSPAITDQGDYNYGISVPTALMSTRSIIEDGVEVSDELLPLLKTKAYETHVVSFGKRGFPLNAYGTRDLYKICPDIGEYVADDGLLFAWRELIPKLAAVQLSPRSLLKTGLDPVFDKKHYVRPGAKVIDIKVYHEVRTTKSAIPTGTTVQLEKYRNAQQRYCETLISEYEALAKRYRHRLKITPEFEQQLVQAHAYSGKDSQNKRLQRTYRADPLDEWRVEVTIEYDLIPTIGFKLTGLFGDKGVICNIKRWQDMPVDMAGNRAMCIMDANSTIKRMNVGRLAAQLINAASRDLSVYIRNSYAADSSDTNVQFLWNRVVRYYEITSKLMYDTITGPKYRGTPRKHIEAIVKDGIYIRRGVDDPKSIAVVGDEIRREFPPVMGPVTYRGQSGRVVTTIKNILIGDMYLMLLEKTGMDFSGVASSKRNHFGLPAKLTNGDKHSEPVRAQPIREWGEAESRLGCAASDGKDGNPVAEMIDLSANPSSHRAATEELFRAPKPTDIKRIIDRVKIPLGKHRSQAMVAHQAECAGWKFIKGDYNDD